jgi:hypothetical protein
MAVKTQALTEQIALVGRVSPQLIDNNTGDTAWVDISKFRRVAFLLLLGATDITVDFKLRSATDSSGTSAADISGYAITQFSATDDNKEAWIEIDENKMAALGRRYVSARVTVGDGTLGGNVAVAALAGVARYEPASDNDLATVAQIIRNV